MSADGGGLNLDSSQETFEGTMPYRGPVKPPVPGLVQWAYSLVVEGLDHAVPFTVTLVDSKGTPVASSQSEEGVASIEGELREQSYELCIEGAQPLAFRAICSQTYGYRG